MSGKNERAFALVRVVGTDASHFGPKDLGCLPGRLPTLTLEALGPICRLRRRDLVPVALHERTNIVGRHRGIVACVRAQPARCGGSIDRRERWKDGWRTGYNAEFGSAESLPTRKWRNWQTHQLEGLAVAIPWGFESPLPHQNQIGKAEIMQTLPITSERLAELEEFARRRGKTAADALDEALAEYLQWERQDYQEAVQAVRQGVEDVKAGRTKAADEFFDDFARKHGLPR